MFYKFLAAKPKKKAQKDSSSGEDISVDDEEESETELPAIAQVAAPEAQVVKLVPAAPAAGSPAAAAQEVLMPVWLAVSPPALLWTAAAHQILIGADF